MAPWLYILIMPTLATRGDILIRLTWLTRIDRPTCVAREPSVSSTHVFPRPGGLDIQTILERKTIMDRMDMTRRLSLPIVAAQ